MEKASRTVIQVTCILHIGGEGGCLPVCVMASPSQGSAPPGPPAKAVVGPEPLLQGPPCSSGPRAVIVFISFDKFSLDSSERGIPISKNLEPFLGEDLAKLYWG